MRLLPVKLTFTRMVILTVWQFRSAVTADVNACESSHLYPYTAS